MIIYFAIEVQKIVYINEEIRQEKPLIHKLTNDQKIQKIQY